MDSRAYGHVITKISRIDGLPNFLISVKYKYCGLVPYLYQINELKRVKVISIVYNGN